MEQYVRWLQDNHKKSSTFLTARLISDLGIQSAPNSKYLIQKAFEMLMLNSGWIIC